MAPYLAGHDPFMPGTLREQYRGDGVRPSCKRLLDLIDTDEDSWPVTAGILREMVLADVEMDRTAITAAVKLGRRRWEQQSNWPLPQKRYETSTLASMSDAIVYYIRRAELIKIGTTMDPASRFDELLPDEILAFEPGSYPEETFRHRQFAHLRRQGEHFAAEAELLYHIERTRTLYGDPDPSWPTVTSMSRERRAPMQPASGPTMTALEAEQNLGVNSSTLRGWVHRGKITPMGRDQQNRQLYYVEHLTILRDNPRTRGRRAEQAFAL